MVDAVPATAMKRACSQRGAEQEMSCGGPQGLPVVGAFIECGIERSKGEQACEHGLGDRARAL